MILVRGYPPHWAALIRAYPQAKFMQPYISYGDKIYNTSGRPISGHIRAHEMIHGGRQLALGVEKWWTFYMTDISFCLAEELLGYKEQIHSFNAWHTSLKAKQIHIKQVVASLAGPLYNNMITVNEAYKELGIA